LNAQQINEKFGLEVLLEVVETLRGNRSLNNEAANCINGLVELEMDDAILANRAIDRGADPFAIQYLADGEVQPHIRSAHFNGPGSLEGEEQDEWLFLASLSEDEHGEPLSLREKLLGLADAVSLYREMGRPTTDSLILQRARRIEKVREQIKSLPFEMEEVSGRSLRVYTADLGFAAAYWSGEVCAAVRQPDGLTFVGSKGPTLAELGIQVDKPLSEQFGIIFP
jgi:hypothetical protein